VPRWRKRDVVPGIGPLEQEDVARMLSEISAGSILHGFRGVLDLMLVGELYFARRTPSQWRSTRLSLAEYPPRGNGCKDERNPI
jgi:hypothetical protein